ncbi:MAG: SAM-dependent chlorinase/fluorinase [Chlamydiales bacterium]|nr:SAM-dependent chlorinase/fluorinase [Chlamydiales bacterium]
MQVVIITDCWDVSFVEMHQTLINELSGYQIAPPLIAPAVAVKPFSVMNAAFHIRLLAELYPPKDTIFVVVVSGVGTNPARIFGRTKTGLRFVGNNSGYFQWLLEDFGLDSLYENKLNRVKEGRSFGGKYAQIPTAARLLAGIPMEQIGEPKNADFLSPFTIPEGTVVHIDNFGLMKIKAEPLSTFTEGEPLCFSLNGTPRVEGIYTEKMKRQVDGTWTLYSGSSLYGLPELGRVRSNNSAQELGAEIGDSITWR